MNKKIAIAGGTGLIGKKLAMHLHEMNYEIIIISRKVSVNKFSFPVKYIDWEMNTLLNELEGVYGIVNLSGANIGQKWTPDYKQEILRSRVEPTQKIVKLINEMNNPPKVFFSMSAVGYYGDTGEKEVTEEFKAGKSFLSLVCSRWEAEANKAKDKTRHVIGRTGIVLDKDGGALNKLLTSFKSYIGGALGSGKQWMPWIHIDDVVNLIVWALENENIEGALNITSINPVRMDDFAKTLGKVMNKPSFFRVPAFVIKALMGESATIVLDGNKVIPAKALQFGYEFRYNNLVDALKDLLKK
jgi:uncharacterized protein